jgi:hypothetical protein
MNLGSSALLVRGNLDATFRALVSNILEGIDEIRDTWQAEENAKAESPQMGAITADMRDIGHAALVARRAVDGCRRFTQCRNWHRGLEHGDVLDLLLHHGLTGLLHLGLLHLWLLHVLHLGLGVCHLRLLDGLAGLLLLRHRVVLLGSAHHGLRCHLGLLLLLHVRLLLHLLRIAYLHGLAGSNDWRTISWGILLLHFATLHESLKKKGYLEELKTQIRSTVGKKKEKVVIKRRTVEDEWEQR